MDKKRKEAYNKYFAERVFERMEELMCDCTCSTHAQEKVCKKYCDNNTNNKPFIKKEQ